MSRKTHGLLTEGLTSELFLMAFIEPNNARKIGQRLQNTTKTPTNYSKINPAIHNLTIARYLKHKEDGKYYPIITSLVNDIKDLLKSKNIILNEGETELLKIFLKRDDFLKAVSPKILKDLQSQPKGIHKINSLDVLCSYVGMICASFLFLKKGHKDFKKSFKKLNLKDIIYLYNQYDPIINNITNMAGLNDMEDNLFDFTKKNKNSFNILKNFINHMPSIMILSSAPNKTLEKFSNLWNQYEGFKMGTELALGVN